MSNIVKIMIPVNKDLKKYITIFVLITQNYSERKSNPGTLIEQSRSLTSSHHELHIFTNIPTKTP